MKGRLPVRPTGLLAGLLIACLALPARAQDHVTVVLDWFVNPDHAALIVADEIGAFRKRGIELDLIAPADPDTPVRIVAAGDADFAIGYQISLYHQVERGLPIVRVASLIDGPVMTLETLTGHGHDIASIADLRGRRIGLQVRSSDEMKAILQRMLSTAGLSLTDVRLTDVGAMLETALLTNEDDAQLMLRNFETPSLEAQHVQPRGFNIEDYGVPPFDNLIVVTRRGRERTDLTRRFVAALSEGAAYVSAHPDESWQLLLRHHPDLDDTLNRRAYALTLPALARHPARLDEARYRNFGKFLQDAGVVHDLPPFDHYAIGLDQAP